MKEISQTVFFLFPLLLTLDASAQITVDGATSTTVTPTETGVRIDDGNRSGGNLFHSFGEFSIPTGSEAFFNNTSEIANIFSRVTGGNISNINGLIRANGAANLFLINPAGIVFGNDARLQLGGSFYGSTADSIIFPDGEFSATDLDNPPLITVNAPIGLGFRDNPGEIVNTSVGQNPNGETNITGGAVGLQVANGETLALVGGDVLLDDGNLTAKGGHLEIGSVKSAGEVGITETDTGFALDYGEINSFGDITLQNTAVVDVTATGGGSVSVTAKDLTLDSSSIISGIAPNSTSADVRAGDIIINANESVTLTDGASLDTRTSGVGNAGDIFIEAREITLSNSDIFTEVSSTGGIGNAGNINISTNSLSLQNGSTFLADTENQGNAGNIEIKTASLSITDGGFISTSTFGQGNGGKITINASESVSLGNKESNGDLESYGRLFSNVGSGAVGNSGGVEINTGSLFVKNSSQIQSQVRGQGNSGKIIINAQDTVSFDGRDETDSIPSAAFSRVIEGGNGNSGGIEINANSLSINNRAQLLSNTAGTGNAGDINIQVAEEVKLVNSTIISEITEGTGIGEGGDINIKTGSLVLQDASSLLADTENIGDAGDITIEASERVILEGEGFSASTNSTDIFPSQITATVDNFEGARGEGGSITISTPFLSVADGGFISTSTLGLGNAGDVSIEADNISVDGFDSDGFRSFIASEVRLAEAKGNGGDVEIITDNLSVTNGAEISVSTFGRGDAGDLSIFADNVVIDGGENGFFTGFFAQVGTEARGKGGSINIGSEQSPVEQLNLTNGAGVSVSTFGRGDAGDLSVFANNVVIDGGENGFQTGFFAQVREDATGQGGNINIGSEQSPVEQLNLTNGAGVSVSTFGRGDAGDLSIFANNVETDAGENGFQTGFFASVREGATGQGGNINIGSEQFFVKQLNLTNGAEINVNSEGQGIGGNLFIQTSNLTLDSGSLFASTAFGQGGNITLKIADDLILRNNSLISAEAIDEASGGNVNINAEFIIAYPSGGDGNDITASAEQGQGGAISITAESLFGLEERRAFDNNGTNDIDASSGTEGLDGTVTIETPDNNPLRETPELTDNLVSTEVITTSDVCSASDIEDVSSLAVQGKGGVAPEPTAPFDSDALIVNGEPETSDTPHNNSHYLDPNEIPPHVQPVAYKDNGEPIYIARGVMKQEDGTVILTAVPHQNISPRTPENPYSC
ncbi:filamentous hemagglutinin N-terminal domain-containing protein, partial [Hyella patelloides]|uniref:two-partner secretion domain-containing protein n=1 Tax=Hyella patelloides TaxID=1982969 RepID=UPI00119F1EB3